MDAKEKCSNNIILLLFEFNAIIIKHKLYICL